MTLTTERQQFEQWWETTMHNGNPPRFGWEHWRDGDGYRDDDGEFQGLWQAWQDSRKLATPVWLPELNELEANTEPCVICGKVSSPPEGMGLTAWLASGDTGLSSRFMASKLTGMFETEYAYPHDPADFGRCLRLVEAVPELESKIRDMSQHGKEWAVVVAHWHEWGAAHRGGNYKRFYRLMKLCYEEG